MAAMLNAIGAGGASWSGSAPTMNTISAQGAIWTGGGAGASGAAVLSLGGTATAAAAVRATAAGELMLTGGSRIAEGELIPSARREAVPSESRNSGHLVPRHRTTG